MSPPFPHAPDADPSQLDGLVIGDSSIFGRLMAVCSLRAVAGGGGSAPWAEQAIRALHQRFFSRWLGLDLEEQKADLTTYLWRTGAGADRVAELAAAGTALAPEEAPEAERGLFAQSLAVLYTLFFRAADPREAAAGAAGDETVPAPSAS